MRSSTAPPAAEPISSASAALRSASRRASHPGRGIPWKRQKRSSTPYTGTRDTRRPVV